MPQANKKPKAIILPSGDPFRKTVSSVDESTLIAGYQNKNLLDFLGI